MAKVVLTLKKSMSGRPDTQRRTLAALGLRKLNQSVEHNDSPGLRGQVNKIKHLVDVQVVEA